IYHEHFQYYTVFSAMLALAEGGLTLVDVEMLSTHGGSIRLWARPEGAARRPSERVTEALCVEKAAGLHDVDGYVQLRGRTEAIR
ncbi:SAM-dependent methyltransferase, partial [Mycolicibacterium austroafricanum]